MALEGYPKVTKGSSLWRVLRALHRHGAEFENGNFTCPLHVDASPSLSVMVGKKLPVVLNCKPCRAEMTQTEYIARFCGELGLDPAILSHETGEEPGRYLEATGRGGSKGGTRASGDWKETYEIKDTYIYDDEWGHPVFAIERWEPKPGASGRKQFLPRWFDGVEWITGLPNHIQRVPFGLSGFDRAKDQGRYCYLVEGEKNVKSIGAWLHEHPKLAFATCFAGGAEGTLDPNWTDWFRGFPHVFVVADRDLPGLVRALELHAGLTAAGIPATIEVSAVKDKGADVSDHLAAGFELGDLLNREPEEVRRQIEKLRKSTPITDTAKDMIERVNADPDIDIDGTEIVNPHAGSFYNLKCEPLYDPSDLGMAQYMVHLYGDNFRYVVENDAWFVFDGKLWREDERAILMQQFAKQTVEAIRDTVSKIVTNTDEERAAWARAKTFCTRRADQTAIKKCVDSARSEPDIAISAAQMNTDPMILAVRNGVVDLRTGEIRSHIDYRDRMISIMAPVIYDPNAEHKEWTQFIQIITQGDYELEQFLQRAAYESLTGVTTSKCFINLFDRNMGNTGKTQFVNCLANMLGRYAAVISPSAFAKNPHGAFESRIPAELAETAGKRMVYVDEITSETTLDTGLIKRFTKGDGRLQYRTLHKKPWEGPVTATLWMDGNSLGRAFGGDTALFARWQMVELEVDIEKALRDRGQSPVNGWSAVMSQDAKFQSAVLAWVMRARVQWLAQGIGTTDAIQETVVTQKAIVGGLGGFQQALRPAKGAKISQSEVWQAYQQWAENEGIRRQMTRSALLGWIEHNIPGVEKPEKKMSYGSNSSALVLLNLEIDLETLGLS